MAWCQCAVKKVAYSVTYCLRIHVGSFLRNWTKGYGDLYSLQTIVIDLISVLLREENEIELRCNGTLIRCLLCGWVKNVKMKLVVRCNVARRLFL